MKRRAATRPSSPADAEPRARADTGDRERGEGDAPAGAEGDRLAVARALRETAALLRLRGGNPFRARAYERAARAVEALAADLGPLIAGGRLTEIPGVGAALAATIAELHRTGRSQTLERLRSELPPGVLDLARVPGLRVERIAALHEALGVASVADLRDALESGRVRGVRGFGPRTEARLIEAVRRLGATRARVRLDAAVEQAESVLAWLRASPDVHRAEAAGSVRRAVETVGNLDLAVAATDAREAIAHALRLPLVVDTIEKDEAHVAVSLTSGLRADVRVAAPARFGALWVRATGSAAHVAALEGIARERRAEGALASAGRVRVPDEESVYRALGLPLVPPEMREDAGEVEAAREGALPSDLVCLEDLRGLVHCHTLHSDGTATIEQMARGAEALGAEYITITDHSPTASYAGGLRADRLKAQWDEIARVQERVRVRILRGTESDILADGALDYPDAILEQMDVVVASIHARHRMDEEAMTRRLVRAMRHPAFKIWGHALGRLIERRPPIACRVEEVLDALAESRGAVEVNGDPRRLDMEPRWIRRARARGIPLVISTDAHSVGALRNARWGVLMARRGWVRRDEVLNARGVDAFRAAVRPFS